MNLVYLKKDRPHDPPVLRGWIALQHASRDRSAHLFRMPWLADEAHEVTLETAYALADRGRVDELFISVDPDA
jgi:hypothetical protein